MFVFQMWEGTFLLGNVTHIPGSPSPECQTGLLQQGLTHPWHPHDTRCPVPPGTQCSVSPGDKPLPLATGSYCSAHKVSVTVRSAEQINLFMWGMGALKLGYGGGRDKVFLQSPGSRAGGSGSSLEEGLEHLSGRWWHWGHQVRGSLSRLG